MLEEMLITHSTLVKAMLVFLVIGLFIPMMKKEALGFKKASFIYTMVFQAIMTMIVFAGIIALVVGAFSFDMSIIVMIAVFAVMMGIEISKYKRIKKGNLEDESTFKMLRAGFVKTGILNIIILVAMVVLMILKAKGVVSF